MLFRTVIESPIGELTLTADAGALVAIMWDAADPTAKNPAQKKLGGRATVDVPPAQHDVLAQAAAQLAEYFAGTRSVFDIAMAPSGTPFQLQAWDALRTIPFGETISYGAQAAVMGDKRKARAVGAANSKNPIPIIVPCHRVVGASGHLTGFAGGVTVKAWLLDHERRVAGG